MASFSPNPRASEDEMRCASSSRETVGEGESFLSLPLVLFKPSMDWMVPTRIGGGGDNLLYQVHQLKCYSYSEAPS